MISISPFILYFLIKTMLCFSGLSHTPRSDKSEIAFNKNDETTYAKYIKSMGALLEKYDVARQTDQMKFEECGGKYTPLIQGLSYSLADP